MRKISVLKNKYERQRRNTVMLNQINQFKAVSEFQAVIQNYHIFLFGGVNQKQKLNPSLKLFQYNSKLGKKYHWK